MSDRVFALRLLETADGFAVLASNEHVGHTDDTTMALSSDLRDDLLEVQDLLLEGGKLTRGRRRVLDREVTTVTTKRLGTDLFAVLMPDKVRTLYRKSKDESYASSSKLRIQLDLTGAPSVAHVPWELAFDPDPDTAEHVCLLHRLPMHRAIPDLHYQFTREDRPVQILGMIAKPRAADGTGTVDTIQSDREQASMTAALKSQEEKGRVKLYWTAAGTRGELRRQLLRPPPGTGWSVFHFIGHGGFDTQRQEGYLNLEKAGGFDPLYARELRQLMSDPECTPQLVVLNCCSGATSAPGLPFSSLAANLVRGGIRAVIAMQFEISEPAAQVFTETFYDAVATGITVGKALTATRQVLLSETQEWVTPSLYMNGDDFALVDEPDDTASPTP